MFHSIALSLNVTQLRESAFDIKLAAFVHKTLCTCLFIAVSHVYVWGLWQVGEEEFILPLYS